jgi:co-chaperonin GroES (HSP10)
MLMVTSIDKFGTPPDPVLKQTEFTLRKPRSVIEKAESQNDKLPSPTGYRILIIPEAPPERSRGGIEFAESTKQVERLASVVAYVVALGPDAYKDPVKFPEGPWCKPGDYIIFGRYAGSKITMHGDDSESDLQLRLLNDDEVLAIVDNPKDYVGVK